ncbi:uncharacterized protein CBL_08331 [Carabus blaptoides fortunei]
MNKVVIFLLCVGWISSVLAAPRMRIFPQVERKPLLTMNLPANWTNIREEVADTFTCDGKSYGYYADVDNDCQVFHVCLPVDGRNLTYRWSFICPEETIFNQESFTCARLEDAVSCEEAPNFYKLNDNFGQLEEISSTDDKPAESPNAIDGRTGRADNKRKSRLG